MLQHPEPRVRFHAGPPDVQLLNVSSPAQLLRGAGCQMIERLEMTDTFRRVEPVRPPAAYIGGKKRLADLITQRIDAIPHATYAEPFVGMGGVFFRRQRVPISEVINDISRDVATLFRILQRHYPQFMETLKFQITSRREFERLSIADPSTLTDLERAARFLYLQRLTFGGKVAGRTFGVTGGRARFDVTMLGPVLDAIHERLAGVTIECLAWSEFVERYDAPATLFYLDPPYWGSEDDYGFGVFKQGDFARLALRLSSIAGKFILSVNDVPGTREAFARFHIENVTTRYTLAGGGGSEAAEILVFGPGNDPSDFPQPQNRLFP